MNFWGNLGKPPHIENCWQLPAPQLAGGIFSCSRPAALPLELVSYEGHPSSRLVRAALCPLELRYVVRTTPFGSSPRRGAPGAAPIFVNRF